MSIIEIVMVYYLICMKDAFFLNKQLKTSAE